MTIQLAVLEGAPTALARHRMARRGNKLIAINSQKSEMLYAGLCLKKQLSPQEGPIHVYAQFFMPIPASVSKKQQHLLHDAPCQKKPDLDNLLKFLLDVLNGIAFHDDRQVTGISAFKQYSVWPRTEVWVMSADCEPIKSECI